jgi:hypothetical protein
MAHHQMIACGGCLWAFCWKDNSSAIAYISLYLKISFVWQEHLI